MTRIARGRVVSVRPSRPGLARFALAGAPVALALHALPVPTSELLLAVCLAAYAGLGVAGYAALERGLRRVSSFRTPGALGAAAAD